MNRPKKALVFVLGLFLAAPLLGCGVGTTQAENNRTIRRVAEYDARMMTDDLGLLTQTNRPAHTSRWVID
ncbi:MAG TPA: hypothetical protein VJZ71_07850 [Phycisphaerae bacterium]|nr:hypothetical protein [Phycisphaerae bacterium]